jgi:hypothetical protein
MDIVVALERKFSGESFAAVNELAVEHLFLVLH